MKEYPEKRQREVLSYVTGSDRVPIAGFAALKFVVYKAGDDAEVLPGAATCFNVSCVVLCVRDWLIVFQYFIVFDLPLFVFTFPSFIVST